MKLFLCDKTCPCGLFSEMLVRLKEMGIEPSIHDDDPEEIHLEFNLPPQCGSLVSERKFNLALFKGIVDQRRPCIVCCGRGYNDLQEKTCEKCGEHLIICKHCYDHSRLALANCSLCKIITQDEDHAAKWKPNNIKDFIVQSLTSHGMSLDSLISRLESACGRKLDIKVINNALSGLVLEGSIKINKQRVELN